MRFGFIILLFLIPFGVIASSSGFITRTIWVEPDKFFADDAVRVYAGIFNGFEKKLEGTVEFYDGEKKIGEVDFLLEKEGRTGSVWVDWIPKVGEHTIRAVIINAKSDGVVVELPHATAELSLGYIQPDTDGDAVGDDKDEDDDNDGLADEEEMRTGTDQKNADTDGDGFGDFDEVIAERNTKKTEEEVGSNSETTILSQVADILERQKTSLAEARPAEKDKEAFQKLWRRVGGNSDDLPLSSVLFESGKAMASLLGKTGLGLGSFLLGHKVIGLLFLFVIVIFLMRRRKRTRKRR